MVDIKKEKILTSQLELGMFVVALDKPWIESDFLMQGFVLEDPADFEKMIATCAHVFIDRTKSIGNQFTAAGKHDVAVKRLSATRGSAAGTDNKNTPILNKARRGEKVSFVDILREVKNHKNPKNSKVNSNNGTIHNAHSGTDAALQTTLPYEQVEKITQAKTNGSFLGGIGNFVGSLFRREKLASSIDSNIHQPDLSHLTDEERILYEQEAPVEQEIAAIYPVFEQSEIVTRDIFDAAANQQQVDISSVSDVLDNMVESIGRTPDALLWLAKLKKADGLSYNLALNVSVTLMAFNSFLALPKEQIKASGLAGLLQDIGKVNLSADILLKKGKLTREEYEYAKKHVDESLAILNETSDIDMDVLQLVAEHHERIDGSGYPHQLKGSHLNLLSQTAGLIDTYCAMTNHRSYAEGAYHQQALDKIHALGGKQFSTEIINQLIQFMGIYPVSSLVELNTGEIGVVIQQNQVRRLMPRVMVLLDGRKERYGAPVILDLIQRPKTPGGELYTITKGVPADSYGLDSSEFYV